MKLFTRGPLTIGFESEGNVDEPGPNDIEVYVRLDASGFTPPMPLTDLKSAYAAVQWIERELESLGIVRLEVRDAIRNGIIQQLPRLTALLSKV